MAKTSTNHKPVRQRAISDLAFDLITAGRSSTGVASIVLNYAKIMTGSTLGYASIKDWKVRQPHCSPASGA